MVGARKAHVKEALANIVHIVELKDAVEKSTAKQTELQVEVNGGFTSRHGDLKVEMDLEEIARGVRQQDLDAAEAKKQRLEAIIRGSPPPSAQRL